jgi:hypothetical protein
MHSEETKRKISEALKGRKRPDFSQEWKDKIKANNSRFWKGKKLSSEHKEKLRLSHLGQISHNKGKTVSKETRELNRQRALLQFKNGMSKETKEKISKTLTGIKRSKDFCIQLGLRNKGKKLSLETREKISRNNARVWLGKKRPDVSGINSSNWQGGKSFEPYPLGWTKTFREQIRHRDNYKCQICGVHEVDCIVKLHVHHIDYNKENLSLNNLISLCVKCHTKTNYNREHWKKYFGESIWRR